MRGYLYGSLAACGLAAGLFGCQNGNLHANQAAIHSPPVSNADLYSAPQAGSAAPVDSAARAGDAVAASGSNSTSVAMPAAAMPAAGGVGGGAILADPSAGSTGTNFDASAMHLSNNSGMASSTTAVEPMGVQACHVSMDQVVSWSSHGLSDEMIIDRINRSCTVFHLSAADENHLRDMRVSDEVIHAMNDTERRIF